MSEAISEQVVSGLSKISMALKSKSWRESFPLNLTPTQAQILSIICNSDTGTRLNEVAKHLGVTDPTACDAVNTLCRKGLVSKKRSEADQRAVVLKLTLLGKKLADRLNHWPDFLVKAIDSLTENEKEHFLRGVIKMIKYLQDTGDISPARMCINCKYFSPFVHNDQEKPHHCNLVDAEFGESQLRIACPDYCKGENETSMNVWLEHERAETNCS